MTDAKLETAFLNLQEALLEKGVTLQFIKIDLPLYLKGMELDSYSGIGIKTVIHEDDAEVWG